MCFMRAEYGFVIVARAPTPFPLCFVSAFCVLYFYVFRRILSSSKICVSEMILVIELISLFKKNFRSPTNYEIDYLNYRKLIISCLYLGFTKKICTCNILTFQKMLSNTWSNLVLPSLPFYSLYNSTPYKRCKQNFGYF